jgi:hypothetical protein
MAADEGPESDTNRHADQERDTCEHLVAEVTAHNLPMTTHAVSVLSISLPESSCRLDGFLEMLPQF